MNWIFAAFITLAVITMIEFWTAVKGDDVSERVFMLVFVAWLCVLEYNLFLLIP